MTQPNYQIVPAGDRELIKSVEALVSEKRAFVIRADRSFRHTKRLIRMFRFLGEGKKDTNFVNAGLDAWFTGDLVICWNKAANENNYRWRYELTPEGVDLIFDPPA
jgi:hypothetical protein